MVALMAILVKIPEIKNPRISDRNSGAGLLVKPVGFERIEMRAPPVTRIIIMNPTIFQRMLQSQIANPFRKANPQFTINIHEDSESFITVRAHYAHNLSVIL